jgi:uncharacterized protein
MGSPGGGGCTLSVRVQPGAKRDELAGWQDGVLKVRVRAAALEGAANRGLVQLLSRALGVRRSQLSILRGEHHREKVLRIDGLSEQELGDRLAGAST